MIKADSDVHKTWYSIKEIADYLGISKGTLYKMTKQNKIPFYKVGKLIKFDRTDKLLAGPAVYTFKLNIS
jgi:excisionase family DNA binding protein